MLDPHEELDRLHERSTRALAESMAEIQVARLRSDFARADKLQAKLGRDLGEMLAAADLLGRRRFLLEMKGAGVAPEPALFAAKVPFVEAVEALLKRTPVLAEGWKATREAWLKNGFALAKSTTKTLTRKVRGSFERFLRGGLTVEETTSAIRTQLRTSGASITKAYADTVFRTVVSTAYSEGRKEQAKRPGVRRAACGWRYVATTDRDVRENHLGGHDMIAHVDDKVWETHSPPNGYNCRCALEIVPTKEMVELGLATPEGGMTRSVVPLIGFIPDAGFSGRRSLL
jgi:SPP1 gp7 family putative phage head morphogenesis protein